MNQTMNRSISLAWGLEGVWRVSRGREGLSSKRGEYQRGVFPLSIVDERERHGVGKIMKKSCLGGTMTKLFMRVMSKVLL